MSFFSRPKSEVFERNTRIAELESKLETLTNKVEKLELENSELRAEIVRLKSENDALKHEKSATEDSDDDDDGRFRKLGAKIEKEKMQAAELKQAAMTEYALELKRVKLFADKWQAFFADKNTTVMQKQELCNLLSDVLTKQSVGGVLSDKEKADAIMKKMGTSFEEEGKKQAQKSGKVQKTSAKNIAQKKTSDGDEDSGFNLDDAVNPKGTLDLEELCKELGVFNG
jgi:hypothetical protein